MTDNLPCSDFRQKHVTLEVESVDLDLCLEKAYLNEQLKPIKITVGCIEVSINVQIVW